MTYISSRSMSLNLQQSALQIQSDYAKAQTEVSTGKHADLGLSLGYATGKTVSLTQEQAQLQAITDTNSFASTRLTSTQSALSSASTTAQSMLSSLISSFGAGDSGSKTALASQATDGLQSLIDTLGTSVGGERIFGGINTDVKPVADYASNPPSAGKQAVDSAFATTFGFSQTDPAAAGISGTDMQNFLQGQFAGLYSTSGWSSNWSQATDQTQTSRISTSQTISTSVSANDAGFRKLAQAYTMLSEFGGGNLGESATQAVETTAQSLIGSAVQDLTNTQSGVGVAQASITQANDDMSAQINILTTSVSNLESVDPYKASTTVTALQTQLQATYRLTTQLQQMSLLNYLSNA